MVVLLYQPASVLGNRVEYSEEPFLPKNVESVKGLEILENLSVIGEEADLLIIIYPAGDRGFHEKVDSLLASIFPNASRIVTPHSIYLAVLEETYTRLARLAINVSLKYKNLETLAESLAETYNNLSSLLNATFGLAQAFLSLAGLAGSLASLGDPYEFSYGVIRAGLNGTLAEYFDTFYSRFLALNERLESDRKAAEAAAREAASVLVPSPEYQLVLSMFSLDNYTDRDAIIRAIYQAGNLSSIGLSLEEAGELAVRGREALDHVVREKLRDLPECILDVLPVILETDRVASAESVAGLVRDRCRSYVERTLLFPDSIPTDYRRAVLADGLSAAYVFFDKEIDLASSARLIEEARTEFLAKIGENPLFYGSVALKADLYTSTEDNIKRIDLVTIGLVGPLMVLVARSLIVPLLIIIVALSSLIVSFGALSILALLGVKIYYLSRLVAIPIIVGIAVDYSIYYIYRVMEEYGRARDWAKALEAARAGAGKALVLGGVSVVLGFLAYVLTPNQYIKSIGLSLMVSSAVSFMAAYTFLPSVLELVIHKMSPKPPIGSTARATLLRRMASRSIARKRLVTMASLFIILLSLALLIAGGMTTDIRLALPSDGIYNEGYEAFSHSFPLSAVSKLYVVFNGSLENGKALEALLNESIGEGLIASYSPITAHSISVYEIGLELDPFSDEAVDAAALLREKMTAAGERPVVTGLPALRLDIISLTNDMFYKITVPLAALLIAVYLFFGTGSALIPLRLLYTIAVSVVLALALTWLYASTIQDAMIYWTVPLIVIGLMLTLGMDYDVFLTSRVLEEVSKGRKLEESIEKAVESTGPAITVCGILLAVAFSSLMFTTLPMLVQTGLAVSFSILFDTFIVRPVLAPAMLSLAGKLNWWPGKGFFWSYKSRTK
ncbi:MAG: MMPL family transporter [Desulfurococcales archaeon]|nr:MMPL family transporter [Desulfurococcales archaeon]